MGSGAATILLDDEESMHLAAQCALEWLTQQPDHRPGTSYAFIVSATADGRVSLAGLPGASLPAIRRAGVYFELAH